MKKKKSISLTQPFHMISFIKIIESFNDKENVCIFTQQIDNKKGINTKASQI